MGDKIDYGTTWPYAYYDTPLLDDSNFQGSFKERDFTVGAWDAAHAFKSNTTYSYWITTKPGTLAANMVKFSAQKGVYVGGNACLLKPSLCVLGDPVLGGTDFFSSSMPDGPSSTTRFSIVAPTLYPFTYPTQLCAKPPGQPQNSTSLDQISVSDANLLAKQILAVLQAFKDAGGKANVGCGTSRLHEDRVWWPRGGKTQDFDGGQNGKGVGAILIAPDSDQAFWVHGAIWTRYSSSQFGGPHSVVGEPAGNEQSATSSRKTNGAYQPFTKGYLYFNGASNQTFYVANAIAQKYKSLGLHNDQLGFPTSDEFAWQGGARSNFEGGYIYWTASGGAVVVRDQPAPTVGNYNWSSTPTAGRPFSGTVTGTGFVVGSTQLFFCLNGGTACSEHPQAGVKVDNATSMTVTSVNGFAPKVRNVTES